MQRQSATSTDSARGLTRTFILALGIWALAFGSGLWAAGAMKPLVPALLPRPSPEPDLPDTLQILATNLVVLLISASGLFTFALASVITLLTSGLFVGLVVGVSYHDGMSLSAILWLTLPHSMELIGLWLANAVGLTGYQLGRRVLNTREQIAWSVLVEAFLIALALTIIAACIEGEITLKRVSGRYV